jgi:predicted nuclease of predicted toxin-antitoxin system
MNVARLYSNENFPLPAVEALRQLGHDVLTIQEAGHANQSQSDQDVLAFAIRENRSLVTLNRKHFIQLHRQETNHPGLIVCTFDPDSAALAYRIHEAIEAKGQLTNQLVRINRPST